MIALSQFKPLIHLDAPGAPTDLVDLHLMNTVTHFCRESLIVNKLMTEITTAAGDRDYSVTVPSGYKVALVYLLKLDNVIINPWFETTTSFKLEYAPQAGQTLTGRLALYPERTETTVDDILYDDYLEAIVSGTLARLMAQPGKDWSNPQFVEYHRGIYSEGVIDAKLRALKQFSSLDHSLTANGITIGVDE